MEVLGFIEYVMENESVELSADSKLISELVDDILLHITKADVSNDGNYYEVFNLELYRRDVGCDISVFLQITSNPDFGLDTHFKNMKWERHRYNKDGFAIDANTFVKDDVYPEIEITILLDSAAASRFKDNTYHKLYNKLNGTLAHELSHLKQIGLNKEPFSEDPGDHNNRDHSKNDYRYFLLPEEIEAMVDGMYRRSKLENLPIDKVFMNRLNPFLMDGFINKDQVEIIMKEWITQTLKNHPGAEYSDKYKDFINNI